MNNKPIIQSGRAVDGEYGYWIVWIPELVWNTDEVRELARIIPQDEFAFTLRVAIGDEESDLPPPSGQRRESP